MDEQAPLSDPIEALINLKKERDDLNMEISELEGYISNCIGTKIEGATTKEIDGYKVTTKQPVYRKIDQEAMSEVLIKLSDKDHDQAMKALRYKPSLVTSEYRKLQESGSDLFYKLSEAITSTPGKVSVTIKKVEDEED